jgi:hypothetical protein
MVLMLACVDWRASWQPPCLRVAVEQVRQEPDALLVDLHVCAAPDQFCPSAHACDAAEKSGGLRDFDVESES